MSGIEERSRVRLVVVLTGLILFSVVVGDGNSGIRNPLGGSGQAPSRFEGIVRRFDYEGPVVQNPPIVPGHAAEVQGSASVIGVSIKGHHRAYRIAGMCLVDTHVVNDVVERVPVTVTYCDLRRSARAFTRAGEPGEPLNARVRGFVDKQGLLIEINGNVVLQESDSIPAERLDFEFTTWEKWKSAHPDTDIYLGRELDPDAEDNKLRNLSLVSRGVTLPDVEPASRAGISEAARVIGVDVAGRRRAYRVLALSDPRRTVVNDVINGVPVTVTYNHWRDSARAFTTTESAGGPLAVGMSGWKKGALLLELDGRIVPQDSEDVGLKVLPIRTTTWKQWKSEHPDTDVYTGMQPSSDSRD